MRRANLIAGLGRLRRAKERRALEAFVHCDGHYRRAERHREAARDAVVRQMAQARARERALVDSILGRAISSTAMWRLQAELDALAAETMGLQQRLEAADASLQESRQARDAARPVPARHHQARLCRGAGTTGRNAAGGAR